MEKYFLVKGIKKYHYLQIIFSISVDLYGKLAKFAIFNTTGWHKNVNIV
jgi:hypothetical protein